MMSEYGNKEERTQSMVNQLSLREFARRGGTYGRDIVRVVGRVTKEVVVW